MHVLITGGFGFLGWHTACRLKALHGIDARRLGREEMSDPKLLAQEVARADVVIHAAGVNRGLAGESMVAANIQLAEVLADALLTARSPARVIYANSVQADQDNAYGAGKAAAADVLTAATSKSGGSCLDLRLPNLFGEHGRPHYNSFVATFCDLVVRGQAPTVEDRVVELLHVQEAASLLVASAMMGSASGVVRPQGVAHSVSSVLEAIQEFHKLYRTGEVPQLDNGFRTDLFNTYRSHTFPSQFPMKNAIHEDPRGQLFELVRSHGGDGQAFMSTTRPGHTRGDHFHLRRFERFYVVKGEARISIRRLLHDDVITFDLTGQDPAFVDMPTMWVHNILNTGDDDLITMFWSDQILDADHPDQFPELVKYGVKK